MSAIRNTVPGPTTVASIRAANRNRRLQGRPNPLDGAVAELLDVAAGAEFESPAHYVETAGTRWGNSLAAKWLRIALPMKRLVHQTQWVYAGHEFQIWCLYPWSVKFGT
jgi:hypothetical protein